MSTPVANAGPYRLVERLGGGGMGEVWRAVHRGDGHPAAVKLLHTSFAANEWYLDAFDNEVRAVARLGHDNVVRVFDHGRLAGGPWLAMELVRGRPLRPGAPALHWPDLCQTLLSLLDALAHAHARGVVHRDLKPGNVIRGPERVVLVDFGLAHAVDRSVDPAAMGTVVGTPAYMAPEQFAGHDLDYGPWTDLYALGGLGWALATGSPPFGRHQPVAELREAHQLVPPPAFTPRVPVPPGFEAWLRRLLEKHPARRYRRAADAAWSLRMLRDGDRPPAHLRPPPAGPTIDLGERGPTTDATWRSAPLPSTESTFTERGPAALATVMQPALAPDWRDSGHRPAQRDERVGVGLFGLRPLPVVDRESERDALWAALHNMAEGQVRAVLLQGPAGCGKSRLARWLSERAHETGAATVISARHAPQPGRRDGLAPALARHLRCVGQPAAIIRDRVRRELVGLGLDDPALFEALAHMAGGGTHSGFASATERHALLSRFLLAQSRRRPVLLWLDDVQWGADALAFVLHLLGRSMPGRPPFLVLMTAREVPTQSAESDRLDRLVRHPGVQRIEIGPLPPGWRAQLVQALLPLEAELVQQVEHRTEGNPLFMVQLVGDWVRRDLLERGDQGYRLREGATDTLARDLHQVWQARLDRALEGLDDRERHAVEVGAVLGLSLDRSEWAAASRAGGAWLSPELVARLLRFGLMESAAEGPHAGLAWVHAMLRDSVLQTAAEAGRVGRWHRAAARMLEDEAEDRGGMDDGTALRLGRHLLETGDAGAALAPLSRGAWGCVRASEFSMAEAALDTRERALEALGVPQTDPRRCQGWIMRARVARRRGRPAEAEDWARKAQRMAHNHGWAGLRCQALRETARGAWARGDRSVAAHNLVLAEQAARQAGDADAAAWSQRDRGLVLSEQGRHREAAPLLASAAAHFGAQEEVFGAASALLAQAKGAPSDRCAELLAQAQAGFEQSIDVQEPAHALVGLGEVARLRGEPLAAVQFFSDARRRFQDIGAPGDSQATLGLAAARLAAGQPSQARSLLQDLARHFVRTDRPGRLGSVYAHLAWCAAAEGEATEVSALIAATRAELERTGEPDLASAEALGAAAGLLEGELRVAVEGVARRCLGVGAAVV